MPDIIHLLPETVANQIAAGEVVQRPASAVKELIENAIDAGSDKISLIIRDAGKSLIQVIDNGCGMGPSDAVRSIQRHATSKIRNAQDLFAIRTMGFRGEAMASMASIAHVSIKTRRHEDELGVVLEVAGGEIQQQHQDAMPAGTNIQIKNLFYNIPARRNFLKSNSVETRHIIDEFQRTALAHPEIHFTFHHDDVEVYHLTPGTLKQRIVHLFGANYNQRLVPIEESTSIIDLKGFIGKPEFAKKTRGEQFFFVNKRFIKDAYLHHALIKAYEEILPDDTFPLYVLFIEIDPAKIDINVHPTKTEIKYDDEKAIYAIIRSAVKRSLGKYNITPSIDFEQETGSFSHLIQTENFGEIIPPAISFNPDFNPFESTVKQSSSTYTSRTDEDSLRSAENWENYYEITQFSETKQLSAELLEDDLRDTEAPEKAISKRLFQIHKRYIVSQIHSGLVLIDQQAAHERILFEKFQELLLSRQGLSQQSLFPQTISLNQLDTLLLEELLPEIQALGFQLRPFGKNTFVVEGIPADLGSGINEKTIIEQLLESYKNNLDDVRLPKRDNLAKSLAKSAAIKVGTELTTDEMAELIDKLFACKQANVSINGKPVILTFTLQELIARFQN